MRARSPDRRGFVTVDGSQVGFEVHGDGPMTMLLIPPSPITQARSWKGQVHHLSRRHRVITVDGKGNGRSDRPTDPAAYEPEAMAADITAVLDEIDARRAVLVSHCHAALWSFSAAILRPERVAGLVAISPGLVGLGEANPNWVRVGAHWHDDPAEPEGWLMCNPNYWRRGGYGNWIDFWFDLLATEPHSTKQIEDMVGWAMETDAETMAIASDREAPNATRRSSIELCRQVPCPVLVIHGSDDRCQPASCGHEVADLTRGELVLVEGAGHLVAGRHPVVVNRHIDRFVDGLSDPAPRSRKWTRALRRRPRALYVSSPIGLGHARRDVAIAAELARLQPDLEIEWLAQDPVTKVLEAEGETIHPASRWLASESAHIASEATGHELHAFQALRRMDEILVANFMVFQEVIEDEHYDLVIADEAWDIDHFWHENPELKRGAHVWMTDFVGYLPMPEGGEHEAFLTADYNAEMVEHIARFPRMRDRSIFVGDPDDLVPDTLGPGLPSIRDWTNEHFTFSGYITGFTPPTPAEAAEWRHQFGYSNDETVCLVTVGGSGVGRPLLERVIEAVPHADIANLRVIVVAGPRIDPESLDVPDEVEVRGFIPALHRHLAVCDLAVVQGGLTTTMELVAARRPFIYFPLKNHFEQTRHVRYRLERYGAGRMMDFESSPPEAIGAAMVAELSHPIDYVPVATDGAARAASMIAELL